MVQTQADQERIMDMAHQALTISEQLPGHCNNSPQIVPSLHAYLTTRLCLLDNETKGLPDSAIAEVFHPLRTSYKAFCDVNTLVPATTTQAVLTALDGSAAGCHTVAWNDVHALAGGMTGSSLPQRKVVAQVHDGHAMG